MAHQLHMLTTKHAAPPPTINRLDSARFPSACVHSAAASSGKAMVYAKNRMTRQIFVRSEQMKKTNDKTPTKR